MGGGYCVPIGMVRVLVALILSSMNLTVSWAEDSSPHPSGRPFQIGEQFIYTITWLNITAGTAVMGVADIFTMWIKPTLVPILEKLLFDSQKHQGVIPPHSPAASPADS